MTKKHPRQWDDKLAYPSFLKGVMVGHRWSHKRRSRGRTLTLLLPDCCGSQSFTLSEFRVEELRKFLSGHGKAQSRHFPCLRNPKSTFCVTRNFGPDIVYSGACFRTSRIRLSYDDLGSLSDFLKMFTVKCEEDRVRYSHYSQR